MRVIKPDKGSGFDGNMRDNLRNIEVQPPDSAWSGIEQELDNKEVPPAGTYIPYAAAVVILSIIVANIFLLNDSYSSYYAALVGSKTTTSNQININSGESYLPSQLSGTDNVANDISSFDINTLINSNETILLASVDNNNKPTNGEKSNLLAADLINIPREDENLLVDLDKTDLTFIDGKVNNYNINKLDVDPVTISKFYQDELNNLKGFYVGFDAGIHNHWMVIKEDALYPLISEEITYNFDYGWNYGISFGYNFSKNFGLEAEWVINSSQGFKYLDDRHRKIIIEGEINLSYMKFPLKAKYKFPYMSRVTGKPASINLIGGLQYSRLKSSEIIMNETSLEHEPEDFFHRNELGVIVGIEYDLFVSDNYFFSLGAQGAVNTNAGAFPFVNRMDEVKTYNFVIGVNASINYQIPRRKK